MAEKPLRGQVEQYGTGKIKHYHVVIYPQTIVELGLVVNMGYMVTFRQKGNPMFDGVLYARGEFLLEPYVNNSYHFQLLKNKYIRNGLLQVNEWYELDITKVG